MSVLKDLGFVSSKDGKAAILFEDILGDFRKIKYQNPSDYVAQCWEAFCSKPKIASDKKNENNINGKFFEYILATLLYREEIKPIFLGAKVAFVPNVEFDIMLYSNQCGPICLSAKTSLRERYKQADLEAIALKYVHRKSRSYLITMEEGECKSIKQKIKNGSVIGLDECLLPTSEEFNKLISVLKAIKFIDSPSVQVITSNLIVK
jgi:hypothetical protein